MGIILFTLCDLKESEACSGNFFISFFFHGGWVGGWGCWNCYFRGMFWFVFNKGMFIVFDIYFEM